jgi:hypothetical protein
MTSFKYIPIDLVHIILDYDGRMKYSDGMYRNILHKYDDRYSMMEPIIEKKKNIIKTAERSRHTPDGFYFQFSFDSIRYLSLCYEYHFSYADDKFEICFVNTKKGNWKQIRTFID